MSGFLTVDTPLPAPAPVGGTTYPPLPWNIVAAPSGKITSVDTTKEDLTAQPDSIRTLDGIIWHAGVGRGYEWARYTWLVNHADDVVGKRSENVAAYTRADKLGTAPTWGKVNELNIFNGKGAMLGEEINARVAPSVPDLNAQDNGLRFVKDVIVENGDGATSADREVGWTAYLRVRAGNALAYFTDGIVMGAIKDTAFRAISRVKGGVRAFEALGTWLVGIDFSQSTIASGSAIRLAPGQRIDFEPTGCRGMAYKAWTGDGKGDRFQFLVNGVAVLEVDAAGSIYRNGVKVL